MFIRQLNHFTNSFIYNLNGLNFSILTQKLSQILSLFWAVLWAKVGEISMELEGLVRCSTNYVPFDSNKLLGTSSKGLQRHNLGCERFCEVHLGGHAWTMSENSFCSEPVGNFSWGCSELILLILFMLHRFDFGFWSLFLGVRVYMTLDIKWKRMLSS